MTCTDDGRHSSNSRNKDADWAGLLPTFGSWDSRVRRGFWILGITLGAILAYTTRYYVNGDTIAYFDMAEAFRSGEWSNAVNLTYAPAYSFLLSILSLIFPGYNEVFVAKALNFCCLLCAMAACDLFTRRTRKELPGQPDGTLFPKPVFSAICYSAFLLCSLVWVKVQIVTPDLMVFAFILLNCVSLINIRSSPENFSHFGALGLFNGLGYLCKTFFFPFSAVFFMMAALCCGSVRKAVPRILFAVAAMVVIASPLLIAQSLKAGKLSFGEAGNYNYSYFVAGRGESIHQPRVIHDDPAVLSYDQDAATTYPPGVDPAYWALGIKPALNLQRQLSAFWTSVVHLMGRIFLPTIAILIWCGAQFWQYGIYRSGLLPPSVPVMLLFICVTGTLMYCMVVMEIRYVAPFAFIGFAALVSMPRYGYDENVRLFRVVAEAGLLIAFLLGTVVHSAVDQTLRSGYSLEGKRSHREVFLEAEAVADFLHAQGLNKDDRVAIVLPFDQKLYWARLAGVRITGELRDGAAFLKDSTASRQSALNALKDSGFKSVIGYDPSSRLGMAQHWIEVPRAAGYFAQILNEKP